MVVITRSHVHGEIVTGPGSGTSHAYVGWQLQDETAYQGATALVALQYVWGGRYQDELAARDTRVPGSSLSAINDGAGSDRQYQHHGAQWSIHAVTDEAGQPLERFFYDPFGKWTVLAPSGALRSGSAIAQAYGFTNQRRDPESGLWYFKHRYYHDAMGRFISRDPAGYVDGMSLYMAYFAMTGVDPLGLCETYEYLGQVYERNEDPTWWESVTRGLLGGVLSGVDKPLGPANEHRRSRTATAVELDRDAATDWFEQKNSGQAILDQVQPIADGVERAGIESAKELALVPLAPITKPASVTVAAVRAGTEITEAAVKAGSRASNRLRPDPDATGAHTSMKRDAQGNITGYETYSPQTNPRNPNSWQSDKRVDLQGKPHFDKTTGQDIPTPHVHEEGGVRSANPDELPK